MTVHSLFIYISINEHLKCQFLAIWVMLLCALLDMFLVDINTHLGFLSISLHIYLSLVDSEEFSKMAVLIYIFTSNVWEFQLFYSSNKQYHCFQSFDFSCSGGWLMIWNIFAYYKLIVYLLLWIAWSNISLIKKNNCKLFLMIYRNRSPFSDTYIDYLPQRVVCFPLSNVVL